MPSEEILDLLSLPLFVSSIPYMCPYIGYQITHLQGLIVGLDYFDSTSRNERGRFLGGLMFFAVCHTNIDKSTISCIICYRFEGCSKGKSTLPTSEDIEMVSIIQGLQSWGFVTPVLDFLTQTKEFRGWGWDEKHLPITISFLGTSFFAVLGAWGLVKQNRKIWRDCSGDSVSVAWNSVFAFMFTAFFIYGIEINSLACIIQGVFRTLFYIPILVGLYRYKGFTQKESWLSILMFVAIVVMLIAPAKVVPVIFMSFSFAGVIAAGFQPWEIYKWKSRGNVSLELLVVYAMSIVFWAGYGYFIKDTLLAIMMSLYLVVYFTGVYLWLYYWKKEQCA